MAWLIASAENRRVVTSVASRSVTKPEGRCWHLNHALDSINHERAKCHFSFRQQGLHPFEQIIRHINGGSHMHMHKA
jgi:hypothetical protein